MNRFGNYCNSYTDDVYNYTNADGSKYFSNADGSAFYDPGDSGKGRKWYRSPNGVKHHISEGEDINDRENYQDDYQDGYYQQDYQNDYYDDESTQYIPSPRTFILASETDCSNT